MLYFVNKDNFFECMDYNMIKVKVNGPGSV